MADKGKSAATSKATGNGVKSQGQAQRTQGAENGNPGASNSGLDVSGQFRVGDKITIGVRGADIVLTQSHSGREVIVSEATLSGLLEDQYFTDKHA